jgi:hypothetical protein
LLLGFETSTRPKHHVKVEACLGTTWQSSYKAQTTGCCDVLCLQTKEKLRTYCYYTMIGLFAPPAGPSKRCWRPSSLIGAGLSSDSCELSDSPSLSDSSPTGMCRTTQRAPWSRHLQLPQAFPKCPTATRHSGNGRRPRRWHSEQAPGIRTPARWMSTALTYDCLWDASCWGVMAPRTKSTSRPGKAKTVCCNWLWHRGASCWPATSKRGFWPAAAAARAATCALYRTRALHTHARQIWFVRRRDTYMVIVVIVVLVCHTQVSSQLHFSRDVTRTKLEIDWFESIQV